MAPGIFRPSIEDGSFVRVRRSADGTDWEARTKAGVTLRFGGAASIEAEGDHVSAYLLREELDRHGHVVVYDWDTSEGHALLKDVVWNDFDRASRNEVRFEYEARPDRHRRLSNGIFETLTRRLHSAEVRHGGELVRRYELGYGEEIHPSLRSIEMVGRDGASRMPAARFEYTEAKLESAADQVVTMTNAPGNRRRIRTRRLPDLDGDAFRTPARGDAPVVPGLRERPRQEVASPSIGEAQGRGCRSARRASGRRSRPRHDGDSSSRGLDAASLLRPAPGSTRRSAIARVRAFFVRGSDVRLADMDGDRRSTS
jgi:hypothetical protein